MRQAAGVDHIRSAYFGVALVAICLQQTIEIAQPLLRPLAVAAHAEVEDYAFAGRAVLPQVCLMIASTLVVGLHTDRRFIGLQITAGEQIAFHRCRDRKQ